MTPDARRAEEDYMYAHPGEWFSRTQVIKMLKQHATAAVAQAVKDLDVQIQALTEERNALRFDKPLDIQLLLDERREQAEEIARLRASDGAINDTADRMQSVLFALGARLGLSELDVCTLVNTEPASRSHRPGGDDRRSAGDAEGAQWKPQ